MLVVAASAQPATKTSPNRLFYSTWRRLIPRRLLVLFAFQGAKQPDRQIFDVRLVEWKRIVDARNGIYIEKQVFKRRSFRNDPALFIINVISRAGFAERKAPPVRLIAENPDLIIAVARKRPAGPDMVYRAGAPKSIYLL